MTSITVSIFFLVLRLAFFDLVPFGFSCLVALRWGLRRIEGLEKRIAGIFGVLPSHSPSFLITSHHLCLSPILRSTSHYLYALSLDPVIDYYYSVSDYFPCPPSRLFRPGTVWIKLPGCLALGLETTRGSWKNILLAHYLSITFHRITTDHA